MRSDKVVRLPDRRKPLCNFMLRALMEGADNRALQHAVRRVYPEVRQDHYREVLDDVLAYLNPALPAHGGGEAA